MGRRTAAKTQPARTRLGVDDEAELLRRLRTGDEQAFGELVDRYHERLVRFAHTFVHDHAAAEDVAQETWLAALRGLDGYEARSSLSAWLMSICANRARTMFVRQARVSPMDMNEATVDPARFNSAQAWVDPPDPWDLVDARLDASVLASLVRAAIADLPVQQRQVVTLRDVEGLTSTEACEILAISEGNQRVLLHRGRARVRAALDPHLRRTST